MRGNICYSFSLVLKAEGASETYENIVQLKLKAAASQRMLAGLDE